MRRPIVIIFTGHVGSSWLTSLLGNHGSVTQLGFEPIDDFVLRDIDSAPILGRIVQGGEISHFPNPVRDILSKNYECSQEDKLFRNQNEFDRIDTPFIVFKTRLYLEEQSSFFIDLLPRLNPTVILLCRRNKVKNAISQFKRTQLNISHLGRFHETESKKKPVEVDPKYILKQATNFVRRELNSKIYFERLKQITTSKTYEIFYEDLLSPEWRTRFFESFFNELGLNGNLYDSNYLKMTPDNIKDAVANFDELSELFNGTVFQPSLESDEYNIVKEIYTRKLKFPAIKPEPMIRKIHSMFETADYD